MEDRRSDLEPAPTLPHKPWQHHRREPGILLLAPVLMAAGGAFAAGQPRRPLDLRIYARYREEIRYRGSASFERLAENASGPERTRSRSWPSSSG